MTPAPSILITGAGGGMGRATAQRFHKAGWRLWLTDINETSLMATAKALPGAQARAADITQPEACQALAAWVKAGQKGLTALVNAAGIWREGPTEHTSLQDYAAVMDVNVKGTYFMCAAFIPLLREAQGTIINLSSDAGLQGNTGAALYCASKGAVSLFTKALALELAPDGINVNAVCPGDVETPMLKFQAERYGGGDPGAYYARLLAGYPQGPGRARFIQPAEVAGFIFYLCQPEAKPITGANLSMDFGYSAGK